MTNNDTKHFIGKRVELISMQNPCPSLQYGAQGIVYFVDDTITLSVRWDNGFTSKLVPLKDQFKFLK